jgi:glycosyltransferase involved in cell wall biosynthesis
MSKRILFLEPYYGGSHKNWFEELERYSGHQFESITLPAKHWKWRMASAASIFADKLSDFSAKDYDLILCSEFLSINRLRGELTKEWQEIPIACYFHENQILYPWSQHDKDTEYERNLHYIYHHLENLRNADSLIFNSYFHQNSLFQELMGLLTQLPKPKPVFDLKSIKEKSTVLYPGVDSFLYQEDKNIQLPEVPLILWNHRWDEDKNPAEFYDLIKTLIKEDFQFELALLGDLERTAYHQMFQDLCPDKIKYKGKLPRDEYVKVLRSATISPVTSLHDFFGISVVEAILSGVKVFVPQRMAYHEHFTIEDHKTFSYRDSSELVTKVMDHKNQSIKNSITHCERYLWKNLISQYDCHFSTIAKNRK